MPDPGDHHVLASAIKAQVEIIVTYNLKDFPRETVSKYGIEAQHPDEFIMNLFELSTEDVCIAIRRHRVSLKNPPKNIEQYLATLERQSLSNVVIKFREYSDFI